MQEKNFKDFPQKLLEYEELYDTRTGGYWDIISSKYSYGSMEVEVGHFLHGLIQILQPKYILETGTYRGYSTCCIAESLKNINNNGYVVTIDPSRIPHLWEDTDLEDFITWIPKTSQEATDFLKDKMFDMLCLDSDHTYNTIMSELINFEPLLNPGGCIFMHDSLYFDGVGAAVAQLRGNPRFETITLNSPRTHGNAIGRCPGVTIVRKILNGEPHLAFDEKFDGWNVGDPTAVPYLRQDEPDYQAELSYDPRKTVPPRSQVKFIPPKFGFKKILEVLLIRLRTIHYYLYYYLFKRTR